MTPFESPLRMPTTSHRNDIQGLRAVAILLVVLNHAGVGFMGGGYVGVDVFFVLSGFLITGLLLSGAASSGSVSLSRFYVRRGRRILPAAALTLVVTDLVAYQLLNFVRAKEIVQDSIWASLFGANLRFARLGTDYFSRGLPPSPIQHFWSLAVEEQFYLVWPVLLGLVLFGISLIHRRSGGNGGATFPPPTEQGMRRLGIVIGLIAVASLAWSIHVTKAEPASAFFSTLARAWELALGAGLAIWSQRLARAGVGVRVAAGWLGLAAIGVAGVAFSAATAIPGYAALLPTLGAGLLIAAGLGDQQPRLGAGRVLALAPLRYVGDRSYTFYLWHWPVLVIADQYEGRQLSVGVKLLLMLGAFVLSVVTYRCFENPIRRGEPLAGPARAWLRERVAPYGVGLRPAEPVRSASSVRGLQLWPASVLVVLLVATQILSTLDGEAFRLQAAASPATPGFVPQGETTPVAPDGAAPTTSGPGGGTLPAVRAAVQAAQRAAPIPAGLTPPVGELLNSQSQNVVYQFPNGCVPASSSQVTSQICRLGRTSSSRSIVLIGDSHAQMWMPAILDMAQHDGWVVRPLVKSGCSPYTWPRNSGITDAATAVCHAWYTWALGQAKAVRPDVTLVGGAYGGGVGRGADVAQEAIVGLAKAMKGSTRRVVLVADTDGMSKSPVDCLLAHGATLGTCSNERTSDSFTLNDNLAGAASYGGFAFLATRGWFCLALSCPMVVGRTIVYRDQSGHITGAYARDVAGPFRDAFRRALSRPTSTGQ